MRNILLIIWIFLLFPFNTQVWAAGNISSCPIEDTAPSITDYIKNIRKAVTNINQELSSATPNSSTLSNTWDDIARIYNWAISWNWYFTDFSYYLTFPMLNNIPWPIKRDLQLLENETSGLNKYLRSIVKRGYSDISLWRDRVCAGVENCTLEWSALDILWAIIQNHMKIVTLYKQIVTNPNSKQYDLDLILTIPDSSSFVNDLISRYGWTSIETCGNKDGEFWERIKKSIDNIKLNFDDWNDGIKKWKDAWALLVWATKGQTDEDLEIKLLEKELSRQWVPSNMSDVLVKNLKDFNTDNSYSLDNNFILHSFKQIYNAWIKVKDSYNEATKDLFWKNDTAEQNKKTVVWLETFVSQTEKIAITQNIIERLDILYNTQNNFAAIDSSASSKVILNLIKMHQNIQKGSELLKEAARFSSKVCNSQWNWKWNCTN